MFTGERFDQTRTLDGILSFQLGLHVCHSIGGRPQCVQTLLQAVLQRSNRILRIGWGIKIDRCLLSVVDTWGCDNFDKHLKKKLDS